MAAPTISVPTTGTDPKATTLEDLEAQVNAALEANFNNAEAHKVDAANPHGVTAAQVGAPTDADFLALAARVPEPFRVVNLPPESGFGWGIVDPKDRLAIGVTSEGQFSVAGTRVAKLAPESGYLEAVLDELGRIGIGLKTDGTVYLRLSDDSEIPSALVQPSTGLFPASGVACWGDSMTAGAGGGGTSIVSTIAAELGRSYYQGGVGGTTSASIAIRQGGRPFPVTLDGGEIPASVTEVDITDYGGEDAYNDQTSATRTGTLAGVHGTLTRYGTGGDPAITDKYTFTRAEAGSIVSVSAGTPFIFDSAIAVQDWTQVIWAGRNNSKSPRSAVVEVRDDVLLMAEYLTPKSKHFVVVSVCNGDGEGTGTGTYDQILEVNRELAEYFGPHFVDLRSYMVNRAIYDASITPTAQDLTDISNDVIPESLRSDGVHFNADGYEQAGKFLSRFIIARGW